MAITLGQVNLPTREYVAGDRLEVLIDGTLDSSYPTGGYPLVGVSAPAGTVLGLSEIDFVNATVQAGPTATVSSLTYDYVNNKLKALAAGAEVASTTNLSSVVVRIVAKGKGFPIGNV